MKNHANFNVRGFFMGNVVHTLTDIAAYLNGRLVCDDTIVPTTYVIDRVVAPEAMVKHTIAVQFRSVKSSASPRRCGCLVVGEACVDQITTVGIVVAQPRLAFAKLMQLFHPNPEAIPGIHPTAVIDPTAEVAPTAHIGAHVVVGAGACIGADCVVAAGCVVGDTVCVAEGTTLHAQVTLYPGASIGPHCLLHSGAVIGADGFGFVPCTAPHAWEKIPHAGGVTIGARVEVGANTTIDRGTLSNTIIGDDVKIDNQCIIGHNVEIGAKTLICGGTAIGGSTKIGQQVILAGGTRAVDHIEIADQVVIKSCSTVLKSIKQQGTYCSAFHVLPEFLWARCRYLLQKLPELWRRCQ